MTASVEDARLKALSSLAALTGVATPAEGSAPPPLPLRTLAAALGPLLDTYPSKRSPGASSSGRASRQEVCLAFAAEIAQVMQDSLGLPTSKRAWFCRHNQLFSVMRLDTTGT